MKLPSGARINGDGSISFPMKGPPPKCDVEGYTEDPEDAYKWIMVYCKCDFRALNQPYICPSGKTRHRDFCQQINMQVNPQFCNVDCSRVKIK